MTCIAAQLKRFLSSHRVDYRLYCHARTFSLQECALKHNIPEKAFAKAVVLKSRKNYYVAVLPLHLEIDFIKLNRLLKKELYIVNSKEADKLFYDCEPLSYPPIASPYALPAVIDNQLLLNQAIYFEAGSHSSVIRLEKSEFCYLMSDAVWGDFSKQTIKKSTEKINTHQNHLFVESFEKQMNSMKWRAQLPDVVKNIMALSKDAASAPEQLLHLLNTEFDIPLTMASYNYNLNDQQGIVNPALKKWLEFNKISHAVVSESNAQIQMELAGPLGLNALWLHAIRAAKLCYKIALQAPLVEKLDPFLCYAGGLLHNFGLLFVGQMFLPEYRLLNRWLTLQPNESIKKLEQRLLGLGRAHHLLSRGHDEIGYWVMQHWGMPVELQLMVRHHHTPDYRGQCAIYVSLIRLVGALLRESNLGEGDRLEELSPSTYENLGITLDSARDYFNELQIEEEHEPQEKVI